MNAPLALGDSGLLEIDPRPCQLCGLTIDHHIMVDDDEGPEFFCEEIDADAADIVRRWELADIRDRWKWTGEAPPPREIERPAAKPYRTPQSTIDAFFYVTRTNDAAGIAEWLADHPSDEKYLLKIWEQKCSTAAATAT